MCRFFGLRCLFFTGLAYGSGLLYDTRGGGPPPRAPPPPVKNPPPKTPRAGPPPAGGARLCPAKQPQKGLYTKKERRTFALCENSSLFFLFYLSSSGTYSLVCMMLW